MNLFVKCLMSLTILFVLNFNLSSATIVPEVQKCNFSSKKLDLPKEFSFSIIGNQPQLNDKIAKGVADILGDNYTLTDVDGLLVIKLEKLGKVGEYKLDINKDKITLTGDIDGIFYGLQTLKQLLSSGNLVELSILDYPSVPKRGITWQWCFELPEVDFMLKVIEEMAALKYNVIMPEFGKLHKVEKHLSQYQDPKYKYLDRQDYRKILRKAADLNLQVIPLLNSLDHDERSPIWYSSLGSGLDMMDERNYQLLFDMVEQTIEDFESAGVKLEEFNFGMDEASSVLLANSKKYNQPTAELLKKHIAKIKAFCDSKNIRMIIYHDTLMSSKDPIFDNDMNYVHADAANAYHARKDISRDVALIYWNYEPKERYRVADRLKTEGFDIILMPWSGVGVQKMAEQATDMQAMLIGSTWMESGFYRTNIPGVNTMSRSKWMLESLVELAEYSWNSQKDRKLDYDPALYWSTLIYSKPVDSKLTLSKQVVELGDKSSDASNLSKLKSPLAVFNNGQKLADIQGINRDRGGDELILYTPEWGSSSKANGFGTEVIVQDGVAIDRTTWGVGNSPINKGGFVLSGHGGASANMDRVALNSQIEVRDINNIKYQGDLPQKGAAIYTVALPKAEKCKYVDIAWATKTIAPLDGKSLGEVVLNYQDGTKSKFEIIFGRDLFAKSSPGFFFGETTSWYYPIKNGAFYGKRLNNPEVDKPLKSITFELNSLGEKYGLIIDKNVSLGN